jgi:superfamily II DNA or RNA helicase
VAAIQSTGEAVKFVDKRIHIPVEVPTQITLLNPGGSAITLYDYQQEAVEQAIKATRGIINIATNGGKTEIACGIMKCILPVLKTGQKIAFFTHSKEIFTQSHARIEKRLGIKVGKIGAGEWDEQQINVVMIPTITKYLDMPKDASKLPKTKT